VEQRSIAATLSDADALIEALDLALAKQRDMKTAAMQQLLTSKCRLPGFSGEVIVRKAADITANGSESIKIGPFGSQLKKEYLVDRGYKVYGQENIYEEDMSLGNRFIDEERFTQLKSCELKPGDFIISMMGTVGRCMIVPTGIQKGIMDSHLIRLRLNAALANSQFVQHLFFSQIVLNQIRQFSVGGIMEGLSSSIIKKITFPLPPINEQAAIASVLSDMDAAIAALQARRDKTRAIKQGMMQQLLTGDIRLI
jgi:type I restriction enzyme S subunit